MTKATLTGDVNGDGRADLIAVNDNGTYVMLSTGSSFSAPQVWSMSPFFGFRATIAGDVNGDRRTDLVAIGPGGTWVMLSAGTRFGAPAFWSAQSI